MDAHALRHDVEGKQMPASDKWWLSRRRRRATYVGASVHAYLSMPRPLMASRYWCWCLSQALRKSAVRSVAVRDASSIDLTHSLQWYQHWCP